MQFDNGIYKNLSVCCHVNLSLSQVFATTMYMGVFGSGSPKKHRLLSNDPDFLQKIHSKAGFMSRVDQAKCDTKLVHCYIDKNGKQRCTGKKKELKESAYLVKHVLVFIF